MNAHQNDEWLPILAHNLLWLRQERGLSKTAMARELGISIKSLNTLESGELPPRLGANFLIALARFAGVPTWELVSRRLDQNSEVCGYLSGSSEV